MKLPTDVKSWYLRSKIALTKTYYPVVYIDMKRRITETRSFARNVDELTDKKKLFREDFEAFKKKLAEHPDEGDVIPGTGGVRKTRLKSASKGKSGGFRVCYFDDVERQEIFLILIYAKNVQEDLSNQDKRTLKEIINAIKKN